MNTSALLKQPPEAPAAPAPRRRRLSRLGRAALVLGLLIALLACSGLFLNEPLRRSIQNRMNASLDGYSAHLGGAHLQLLGGSVTLDDIVIRQVANPDPPLASIPRLRASVEWRELVFLRLVADFRIEKPRISVNLPQLRSEAADEVPVKGRGWQQAVEAIYPLKINLLRVEDADVTYIDADPTRPLHLAHLNLRASNIRNIHSRDRTYPSPVEANAVVFETGKAMLTGDADFLAEPYMGIRGKFQTTGIPLEALRPVVAHWNVEASGGTLSTGGEVEYAPRVRKLHIPQVDLTGVRVNYVKKAAAAAPLVPSASAATPPSELDPAWDLNIDRVRIANSEFGYADRSTAHSYRLFVDRTSVQVDGMSNHFAAGPAKVRMAGRFMGAGRLEATAAFKPGKDAADLDLMLQIDDTPLPALNDVFRSYGKFDVAAGDFALYSQVQVHGGVVDGYVKPLFHNVEVYDSAQDAHKNVFRKVYESAVDAATKILSNQKRKQVATTVTLHGPIDNPKASTWEVIGKLIENAFFKAILPGFDQQVPQPRKS